jgi:hypothetical protein
MTQAEKTDIVEKIAGCIRRLRDENFKKRPDYEAVAEEVATKLSLFLDGIRKLKIEPTIVRGTPGIETLSARQVGAIARAAKAKLAKGRSKE